MARIIKDYDERLNELLDAAQHLFFQKGYEKTSVNDIINKVGVAKGTFYHYFSSKDELLDKLVERFTLQTEQLVSQLVQKDIKALKKINYFFITIRNWKVDNLELMKLLMRVLYTNDNLLIRHKMYSQSIERLEPLLTGIIKQGKKERVFQVTFCKETAELILSMALGMGENMVNLLLNADEKPENLDHIERFLKVYESAIERILGAPEDTISIIDRRIIELFTMGNGK